MHRQRSHVSLVSALFLAVCNGSNDFGGDFSATSLSGGASPGPTVDTMGQKPASAMAIGTGKGGTGNYAENYKTPNYTQYANQDFKGEEGLPLSHWHWSRMKFMIIEFLLC